MASETMLQGALRIGAAGLPVFPLHTPRRDGACTCSRPSCKQIGKHPRINGWQQQATTTPAEIEAWWRKWPWANIGIPTGSRSGIWELDVDPRHGGDDSLAELVREFGKLPETVEMITGGGGRGILFRLPEGRRVSNRQKIRPGLDVRGEGGLFVAPPSQHRSGRCYEWEASSVLGEVPIALAPEWLLDLVTGSAPERTPHPERRGDEGAPHDPGPVIEGCAWLMDAVLNQAQVSEARWTGLLTIAARLEGGERLAHEWSRAYPGYSPEETQAKFRHAATNLRPATCQHIRGALDGEPFCARCPHAGRIKSPVVLGRRLPLAGLEPPPAHRIEVGTVDDAPLPQETERFFSQPGTRPGPRTVTRPCQTDTRPGRCPRIPTRTGRD